MANTRTLAQLRTSVLSRFQWENSPDILPGGSTSQLNEWINEGIAELYDLLLDKADDRFVVTPNVGDGSQISLVAGQDTYALPSTFYRGRKVEILMSGTIGSGTERYKRLFTAAVDASHVYTMWGLVAKGYRYRYQGQNVVLMPTPQAPDTIRVWYIPYAPRLVADGDTLEGWNQYEELVIQLAGLRGRMREELPTDDVEREIARLTARIRSASDGRDVEPFYLNPSGPGVGIDDDAGWWW